MPFHMTCVWNKNEPMYGRHLDSDKSICALPAEMKVQPHHADATAEEAALRR